MKIGVALSGCGIGGICAYSLLYRLGGLGFEIAHISASGAPAAGALMFACGFSLQRCRKYAGEFMACLKESDLDSALARLDGAFPAHSLCGVGGLSIHAADICTGKVFAFTNDFTADSEGLAAFGLTDAYDALSAAVSGAQGLAPYHFCGHKLGDYSARYGHPVYPFGMLGVKRAFSFSFLPLSPQDSYEVLLSQKLMTPPPGVPAHHVARFPPWQDADIRECEEIASFGQDGDKKFLLSGL